ncbi:MAG: helix-turn-helix transcriptional regulator [Chitinophagaceae bacterium]
MGELSVQDEKLRNSISRRIRELRESTGLTQAQFASSNLIDRQNLNRWENGRGVTIYTIFRFCRLMNISLSDFFDDKLFE